MQTYCPDYSKQNYTHFHNPDDRFHLIERTAIIGSLLSFSRVFAYFPPNLET